MSEDQLWYRRYVQPRLPLIGRERDVQVVLAALQTSRLVTLLGPGGVGKTRLALEISERVKGTALVELSDVVAVDGVLAAIAGAIGVTLSHADADLAFLVTAARERAPALLVIDNLEHLVQVVGPVVEALIGAGIPILATSRIPLGHEFERRVTLEPLVATDTKKLMIDLAERRGITLGANDDAVLGAIGTILEGLPLAIELAVARLHVLSPPELLARLQRSFDILEPTTGRRSLGAVIQGSWDLLDEPSRRIVTEMTVFRGGFDLAAAEAVASDSGAIVRCIDGLVEASLVRVDTSTPRRFSFHEAVRSGLEARLSNDAREGVEARAIRYFASRADESEAAEGLPWLRRERDNLLHAWDRSAGRERATLSRALARLLRMDGPSRQLHRILDGWITAAETLGPSETAEALLRQGTVLRTDCHVERALEVLRRADALARQSQDARLSARVMYQVGAALRDQHDDQAATEVFVACEALAAAAGDPTIVSRSLIQRAWMMFPDERFDDADALLDRAALVAKDLDDPVEAAMVLRSQAVVEAFRGHASAYLVLIKEAFDRIEGGGDRRYAGIVLREISEAHLDLGQHPEALQACARGRVLLEESGDEAALALVDFCESNIALDRGLFEESARCLERLTRRQRIVGPLFLSEVTNSRIAEARLALARGALEEAAALAERTTRDRTMAPGYRLGATLVQAVALSLLGQQADAVALLKDAHAKDWWQLHGRRVIGLVREIVEGDRASQAAAVQGLRQPSTRGRTWWDSSAELRYWGRILERMDQGPSRVGLEVGPTGAWFRVEGGDRCDLRKHPTLRRVLWGLVEAHAVSRTLDTFALVEAGWPDQRIQPESAQNRVYVTLSKLRKMGLDTVLDTTPEGYRLRPEVAVTRAPA